MRIITKKVLSIFLLLAAMGIAILLWKSEYFAAFDLAKRKNSVYSKLIDSHEGRELVRSALAGLSPQQCGLGKEKNYVIIQFGGVLKDVGDEIGVKIKALHALGNEEKINAIKIVVDGYVFVLVVDEAEMEAVNGLGFLEYSTGDVIFEEDGLYVFQRRLRD